MHPATHVLDTVVVMGSASVTAISALLLASTNSTVEMQLLVLPLLGGVLVGSAFIMLNPAPDTRKITIGRSIIGLFFGTLFPQALALFHPSLSEFAVKPVVLLMLGGVATSFAYLLSKPFTREMYLRADRDAKTLADNLAKRYLPPADETNKTNNP